MCGSAPRRFPVEELKAFTPKEKPLIFAKKLDQEYMHFGDVFPAGSYAICDLDGNVTDMVRAEEFESRTEAVEGDPLALTARTEAPTWLRA